MAVHAAVGAGADAGGARCAGECVLDLGCGIGGPAFQMAELYKGTCGWVACVWAPSRRDRPCGCRATAVAVLGIDSSTDLVSEANRSLEVQKVGTSVTFACGDVTTAALARDSFDVLFSRDLLQHVKVLWPRVCDR